MHAFDHFRGHMSHFYSFLLISVPKGWLLFGIQQTVPTLAKCLLYYTSAEPLQLAIVPIYGYLDREY